MYNLLFKHLNSTVSVRRVRVNIYPLVAVFSVVCVRKNAENRLT